jgi:hypothetical protein
VSTLAELIEQEFIAPLVPKPAPRDAYTFALSLTNPQGEFAGKPYDPGLHPGQVLFLVVYVMCGYRNWVLCADAQSGKSWLIQVLTYYHTCELGRDVLYGLPDMRFASDVWNDKLEVGLRLGGLAHVLPDRGSGSGGGTDIETVYLKNAGSISFHGANGKLKGGGNDGRTKPTIVDDEYDTLPEEIINKNETRADAYFRIARIFRSSTVKDHQVSKICLAYDNSAKGRPHYKCPHCKRRIVLDAGKERDGGSAAGFERFQIDITSDDTAEATAAIVCTACGVLLSEEDRQVMLIDPRLALDGQQFDEHDRIAGDGPTADMVRAINDTIAKILNARRSDIPTILAAAPRFPQPPGTVTFGLRWCRFDNPFKTMGNTAQLYRAAVLKDQAGNSKSLEHFYGEVLARQFPRRGGDSETTAPRLVARSAEGTHDFGQVPAEALFLTANIDQQKRLLLWLVRAHDRSGRTWTVQWGQEDICGQRVEPTPDQRIAALNKVRALLQAGFPRQGATSRMSPVLIGLDVAEWPSLVAEWARSRRDIMPVHGTGREQVERMKRGDGKRIEFLEGWYDLREQDNHGGIWKILWLDSDHVKREMIDAFNRPAGSPASAMLPRGLSEQSDLIQHLIAERRQKNPKTGRMEFVKVGPFNDHFDNTYVTQALGQYFLTNNPRYVPPNPNGPKPGSGKRGNEAWGSGLGWT